MQSFQPAEPRTYSAPRTLRTYSASRTLNGRMCDREIGVWCMSMDDYKKCVAAYRIDPLLTP